MKEEQNEKWEGLFRTLGEVKPAGPRPFFYGRLKARMEARYAQRQVQTVLPWWLQQPAYALAGLALLLLLNLAVALGNVGQSEAAPTDTSPQTYEGFVSEYGLNRSGVYADE